MIDTNTPILHEFDNKFIIKLSLDNSYQIALANSMFDGIYVNKESIEELNIFTYEFNKADIDIYQLSNLIKYL